MYVSELGRRGASHPWIFDASVVVLGAGFVALGIAMALALRTRPWGWATPALFVLAGVFAMLDAPLRLDCAISVNHVCHAQQAAGDLSWRHYGHQWASFGVVAALVLTPFSLARAEWPSRLARLTLGAGVVGAALWGRSFLGHSDGGHVGLWQRIGLLIVHWWVLSCAAALILEASPGWPRAGELPRTADLERAQMPPA
jgi:hypothetical protein